MGVAACWWSTLPVLHLLPSSYRQPQIFRVQGVTYQFVTMLEQLTTYQVVYPYRPHQPFLNLTGASRLMLFKSKKPTGLRQASWNFLQGD